MTPKGKTRPHNLGTRWGGDTTKLEREASQSEPAAGPTPGFHEAGEFLRLAPCVEMEKGNGDES